MSEPNAPILDRLPHGASFRFVSEVVERSAGEWVAANWRVEGSEPLLEGHFPGDPIVPGVLLAEALAQAAGLVVGEELVGERPSGAGPVGALLCHIDVRLHEPVRPPAVIRLEARLSRAMEGLYLFDVEASVSAARVASGRLTLVRREGRVSGRAGGQE